MSYSCSGFFPKRRLRCLGGGTRTLTAQFAQEGPVALMVGGAVGGLKKGPPLGLRFLANEPLNVRVQQINGRVEGIFSAALISLHDEGSHSIGRGPQ